MPGFFWVSQIFSILFFYLMHDSQWLAIRLDTILHKTFTPLIETNYFGECIFPFKYLNSTKAWKIILVNQKLLFKHLENLLEKVNKILNLTCWDNQNAKESKIICRPHSWDGPSGKDHRLRLHPWRVRSSYFASNWLFLGEWEFDRA